MVQFSPDSRWLLIIQPDDSIKLIRMNNNKVFTEESSLGRVIVNLVRQTRSSSKIKPQHGYHGTYNRNISRVAFSADSRILVVVDLSGFVDSWVLEGYEDLTQANNGITQEAESESPDEADEDSDDESHPTIILGQHWIRNPAAALLPKLPAAPLVVSFRPIRVTSAIPLTNGNMAVHPTRQNPHPHSHDLPNGEDRLFVLTTVHQMFEYNILAGKLSDWSRRNPPAHLPLEFREIRDRAIGSLWDISKGKERLWLYGTSWLFMFDLTEDFQYPDHPELQGTVQPIDSTTTEMATNRKRKREISRGERRNLEQDDSGAGSKVHRHQLDHGIGDRFRKSYGPDQGSSQWISLEPDMIRTGNHEHDDDESGENEYLGGESELVSLRRSARDEIETNGYSTHDNDGSDEAATDVEQALKPGKAGGERKHWHTYKYRPILGIVSLSGKDVKDEQVTVEEEEGDESRAGLEVVLVERPLWEADLPARYYGDQEWDK